MKCSFSFAVLQKISSHAVGGKWTDPIFCKIKLITAIKWSSLFISQSINLDYVRTHNILQSVVKYSSWMYDLLMHYVKLILHSI